MINIEQNTKLSDILKEYPWLIEEAIKIDEKFKILNNPIGKMFIKKSTISGLSEKAGIQPDVIIEKLGEIIQNHRG